MLRLARTLAAASLAVTALAAAPARADHRCDRGPRVVVAVAPPPPVYVARAYPPPPPPRDAWRRAAWHELREDWRSLERARERFYATWNGAPGRQRRFERWYAERSAELELRRERLEGDARWARR
jgi:hypothetical protein